MIRGAAEIGARRIAITWRLLINGRWLELLRILYARYIAVGLGIPLRGVRRRRMKRLVDAFEPGPIFIIKSTVDWNYPFWQRPQHIAKALTGIGANCLYVSPRFGFDRFIMDKLVDERLILCDSMDIAIALVKSPIIYILSTDNTVDRRCVASMRAKADARLVYDYIDDIDEAVSRSAIPEAHLQAHEDLLEDEAVFCIASARKLFEEVGRKRRSRFALITNGVDIKHFRRRRDTSALSTRFRHICETGKPIIGYYGALASWLDYRLIEHLAQDRPQYEIVLIGPDYDASCRSMQRERVDNLNLIPPVNYDELPSYAAWFDVCFIPFLLNDITNSTSPLKLFEYMALGKPIVSTAITEAKHYESVMIGETSDAFSAMVDRALALDTNSPYWRKLADDAEKNSWIGKADEVMDLIRLGAGNAASCGLAGKTKESTNAK